MKKLWILFISLAAAMALVAAGCSSSSRAPEEVVGNFDEVELGTPQNGPFAAAVAISDNPLVVGSADSGDGILKGVRWSLDGTTASDPETLNPLADNTYSAAFGVNALGVSVGESAFGANFVPVLWKAEEFDAVALPLTQTNGETVVYTDGAAYSINVHGQIVGEVIDEAGNAVAVLWNLDTETENGHESGYGEPVTLPAGGAATAHFINADGWIVGETMTDAGLRGALWVVDNIVDAIILDPLQDHVTSTALGLDTDGRIVGESEALDGTIHAVLWRQGADPNMFNPETLGENASAQAINDGIRIAGWAGVDPVAVVWDTRVQNLDGNFHDVLTSTGFSQGYAQNQGGIIVGIEGGSAFAAVPR